MCRTPQKDQSDKWMRILKPGERAQMNKTDNVSAHWALLKVSRVWSTELQASNQLIALAALGILEQFDNLSESKVGL